ncbi:cysteine sulfinic acid decarboxylase-like isoform X2 [Amphiura filiformis]|uniref:cysteine sulfinic acid decarboxylase-like isoform X2 n=1 Tax=Amphiura filiformis TaxID=82378 RepID=UPI003B2245F7
MSSDMMNTHISEYASMNHHSSNGNVYKTHKSVQMEAGEIYQDDDSGLDMERSYPHMEQDDLSLLDMTNKKSIAEKKFFYDFIHLVYEEMVVKTSVGQTRVIDFLQPDVLKQRFDFTIRDEPETNQRLLDLAKQTIDLSVKPGHPRFFNQLFSGQDLYGLAGTWLTDAINTSQYTYEVAPVFTLMESEVLQRLRETIGYTDGDGIFCPGGSIANMYAMNLARYKHCPDIKEKGLFSCQRLALFTSEQSHYSIKKGAAFLGFGTNNVILVKCDERGKMIPAELEKAILEAKNEGCKPLFVNATGGTTVFGVYDPIDAIADICEKYGMWLHIDAAWGGSALLSRTHRQLLKGIERSNSVTWCQHKMMGVPLQCSAFLLRDNDGLLFDAHCAGARYLFQQDKCYSVDYDTGDKSIQCGRKVDAFKLWMMWKAKGNSGFEAEIDKKFDNARYMRELIREREGFELVTEGEAPNVCFWYVPPSMRDMEKGTEYQQKLHQVAPLIKERMMKTGTMLVGYQPLKPYVNFFRMIYSNRATNRKDVEWIMDEIDRLGNDIVLK